MRTELNRVLAALLNGMSGVLAVMAGYLLFLTAAAIWGRKPEPAPSASRRNFAILIPAHNEELLIGRLLESLAELDYPCERLDVYVVADNCDDATASIARRHGAQVYERSDRHSRAKGFALRWLLGQLREQKVVPDYDAFIVLDADSVVDSDMVQWFDRYLEAGSVALQAYYAVLNADDSPVSRLRYAALAALHYVRPLGRAALGLSSGLKGNGMCFAASVLERFDWNWFALTEDVEFHLALVRAGIRVDFVSQTCVRADMPITLAQAASQNERWERGRLQLLQGPVRTLMLEGFRRRSALQLDAAFDQLIPPLSVPFALGWLCLLGGVLLRARNAALLAGATITGLVVHLVFSLVLVGAPRQAYAALAHAPLYVGWKLALYARALIPGSNTGAWVRTQRRGA